MRMSISISIRIRMRIRVLLCHGAERGDFNDSSVADPNKGEDGINIKNHFNTDIYS
jgi:hypothetical protein